MSKYESSIDGAITIDICKEREKLTTLFEKAKADDCLQRMAPSDLRVIIGTVLSLLDVIDSKNIEIEQLEEDNTYANDIIDAWFDRRELAHEAIDQSVIDATEGYLRVSRVGGMPKEDSDLVISVITDMAHHSTFADLFARAALNPEGAQ